MLNVIYFSSYYLMSTDGLVVNNNNKLQGMHRNQQEWVTTMKSLRQLVQS